MVKTTLSEPSSTERVLEIEVPRERLDKIFDEKVKKYSKEIRLNGFRPGNVPKQVVVQRFKGPISAESLETLVDQVVKEACQEHKIEPVAPGKIDKLENEDGKPIVVKAVLEVDPPLELNEYKLNIPLQIPEVPEAAVEERIQAFRKRRSTEEKVDRPAQMGDVVAAEYQSIVLDGEIQALPKNREFRVELGGGPLVEFEQALVGAVADEARDVAFTFPQDYPNPGLAGKRGEYKLRIVEVSVPKLPELDDALAQVAGFASVAAFRERVRKDLEESARMQAKEAAYEEAMRRLIAANPFEVPKARVQNYVRYKLEQAGHHHAEGEEHDHDHSDLESEAVGNIKRYRILDAIAKRENIKASQEEVDARIRELAEQYGADFEGLKASLRKSGKIVDIREEIRSQKTLDFVIGA